LLLTDNDCPTGLTLHRTFTPTTPMSLLRDAIERDEASSSGTEPANERPRNSGQRARDRVYFEEQHKEALSFVARLSAVDGAVVLKKDLTVIGFGATIATPGDALPREVIQIRPRDLPDPEAVEEDERPEPRVAPTALNVGNRHRSAICFCAQQTGLAIALIASQDGNVSLFARRGDGKILVVRPFELGVGI
jgi:hypothetical protein